MQSSITGIQFQVSDVTPATTPMATVPYSQAVAEFLGGPIESCSRYAGQLTTAPRTHPLLSAVHRAFTDHYPLVLTPDAIWLTLVQGFAIHVNEHAETLRYRFVEHADKKLIQIRRDDFVKGTPENPWTEVFDEFSQQIRPLISGAYELVVADFSTTGLVERAAFEIALLDAMQRYFSYSLVTLCGIPSIRLEGTADDWKQLRQRAEALGQYQLRWWTDALDPVLAQFEAASLGDVDQPFWDSIYKLRGPRGSGNPYTTGWIQKLYPYLQESPDKFEINPWLSDEVPGGPEPAMYPVLAPKAPFEWDYIGTKFEMEMIGGLLGVAQDPTTLEIRPEMGWAVRDVARAK
ncbi:DUF4419 domain-containing protein [Aeoliella sp. SH292]|uniref:DUF4419 domain-containing protein n=1 Tax=Aeoliella sp. SH292 TaxID=3454464 RepID=UPI003F9D450C